MMCNCLFPLLTCLEAAGNARKLDGMPSGGDELGNLQLRSKEFTFLPERTTGRHNTKSN